MKGRIRLAPEYHEEIDVDLLVQSLLCRLNDSSHEEETDDRRRQSDVPVVASPPEAEA